MFGSFVLFLFIFHQVSQFLQTLERDLQLGVGGRLDSVLGQCMYFGLSFSRVGADFRGLLAPIFERAALAGFTTAVNQANARFTLMLLYIRLFTHRAEVTELVKTMTVSGNTYCALFCCQKLARRP